MPILGPLPDAETHLYLRLRDMSENCWFYVAKINERRARLRHSIGPLSRQLEELLSAVAHCEAMWAVEDRLERRR